MPSAGKMHSTTDSMAGVSGSQEQQEITRTSSRWTNHTPTVDLVCLTLRKITTQLCQSKPHSHQHHSTSETAESSFSLTSHVTSDRNQLMYKSDFWTFKKKKKNLLVGSKFHQVLRSSASSRSVADLYQSVSCPGIRFWFFCLSPGLRGVCLLLGGFIQTLSRLLLLKRTSHGM